MISTVKPYQLNNRVVDVDLVQVPVLSNSSKNLIQGQLRVQLPASLATASLGGRVQRIETIVQNLQEAKNHNTRNKILACLNAVFLVGLVVGSFFLGISTPETVLNTALFVIGFISYIIFSMCSGLYASDKMGMIPNEGTQMIGPFGGGIFLPIYEAFTRVSRLEKSLAKENEAINTLHAKNIQQLPAGYQFYREQSPAMLERLNHSIEESQRSITLMEQLPARSDAGERELRAHLTTLEKTRDEVASVAQFYRQFDAV